MTTGAEISTTTCGRKMELGEANDSSINTFPPEEKTSADTPNEPSTVEGDNFLETPAIGEVHSEVNYISPNTSKGTEKPNQILIDDTAILLLRDDQQLEIAANEGTCSKRIQQNIEESNNSQMEHDKDLEKESEKLPLEEVSTGGTNDNGQAVITKVKDEDEELNRVELFENEKNTFTLLKEEAEKLVESLHVDPDNSKESNSIQGNKVNGNLNLHGITSDRQKEVLECLPTIVSSSHEERNKSAVLQGVKSDGTDEKIIDKVDVQKHVLQNLSRIGSNEETEEKPMIKVNASETKAGELLKMENKLTFSPQRTSGASDNESVAMHEGRTEDGELKKHKLCEIEKHTETKLLEEEPKIEKPEDSLIVASEEIKASDLDHGKQISSLDDQTPITHPLDIPDRKTDDKALDAAETIKILGVQNVRTISSNEKMEKNSLIQFDGRQKKNEENLAELLDKNNNIEGDLLKEEVHVEKLVQFFPLDYNKVFDLGPNTETTGFLEDQCLTENPQGTPTEKTVEATDGAENEKQTQEQQNVALSISNEDNDRNSSIQPDASQMKHSIYLEKEIKKAQLIEASAEDINDESTVMHEAETGNESIRKVEFSESDKKIDSTLLKKKNLQEEPEDYKPSRSSEDIEKTCAPDEQSLTPNPQSSTSEKTIDATETAEHVATKNPHEHTDKNLPVQVDCSQTQHEEHLEKESENLSLIEASLEETNDSMSKMHENKDSYKDLIKAELLENERNTVSSVVKEETQVQKHTVSLQATPDDIKASDSTHDTKISTIAEILTENSRDFSNDKKEETDDDVTDTKTPELQNVATSFAREDTEENSLIQVDGSQLKHLERKSENTPLTEAPARDTSENTLAKEEAEMEKPTEYKQVPTEDIKVDRETCSIVEQIPIADPQEISSKKIVENTIDAAYTKDVTTNVANDNEYNLPNEVYGLQNSASEDASVRNADDDESTNIHEDKFVDESTKKDDSFEDEKNKECTSLENEVYIGSLQKADEDIKACASCQDRETTSLEEQNSTMNPRRIKGNKEGNTSDATLLKEETPKIKNAATTIPQEGSEENSTSQVDRSQVEQKEELETKSEDSFLTEKPTGDTIESILKEEEHKEKPTESFQIVSEDIKVPASGQDTEISSKEEQVHRPHPQEISCDKTEKNTRHASYAQEKHIEDIVTSVPNGDNEDNSQMAVYGLHGPSLKEASTGTSNDVDPPTIHESKFWNQNSIKAERIGTEICTEGILVNEKASIETSQESLTTNFQEIMSHHKEDKTIDATEPEDGIPQDKNIATTVPYEEAEENLPIHAEKGSANSSLKEAQTGEIKESDLLEKLTHSVQVPTENIKASTSNQDTQPNSAEQQILIVFPQEISGDKTKENFVGETDTKDKTLEVQSIATNTPNGNNEDNSPTKVDTSSTENSAHHESRNMHGHGFVDETLLKADEVENEKNKDDPSVKEEITYESLQVTNEDIKASASDQDREPCSQEEESLTADREIMESYREDKTTDASGLKEETPNEKAPQSVAVENPYRKVSDVNTDMVVDIAEDHDCNEHVTNVTGSASEPSEQDFDKNDTEKMTVLNDGPTKIPINEKLVETDPTESRKAYAQVPDEENKIELKQQDRETGASQDVSDSSDSVALEEVSSSNVASENDSILNPSPESRKETELEAENEEDQKQDEDLIVTVLVKDSSMEIEEKGVHSCPESATEMQNLEEVPIPTPDDNTIDITDCKESGVAEDATKSFLNDKKLTEGEQEETECKHEKVLSDEAVEEIKEPASIPVSNHFLPESLIETSEIGHSNAERQMTVNKEDLQTGKTPTCHHEETKVEKDREEEAGEHKISDFNSAALDITEAGDKDGANWLIEDVEAKIDDKAPDATESQEVESISVGETSVLIDQCERDDYERNSNEVGFAPEESRTGYEARNQVLESIDQVKSCGMISKAEEDLDQGAAADIKFETVIVEDIFQPKETMKVDISSEKINEEEDDVQNDRLGSSKEEAITESRIENQEKQGERTNTEEICEVLKIPSETTKVSEDPEEAVEKAVEEPEEKLQEENESIDKSLQKEQGKSVENVVKTSNSGEVHGLDHSHMNTGTQDSGEGVNGSTVAFLEDEDKSTRAGDVDNEIAKDVGFQNQNANTSVEDAALGEQSKRPDENILCEAPSTKTLHTAIEDTEGNKENANTIMRQHQAEYSKSNQESSLLSEFTQGIESENQDQKDETCSSDEVQIKDEVKTDTRSKPTFDEDKKNYVAAEMVDFSSHTEDITEVSQHDAAKDVPADNKKSTTKNENQETEVPNEGQEPEVSQKAPVSKTIKQEVEEQQLERTSQPATKENEANSPEAKIIDDDCYGLIENSSSAASEKISESSAHQSLEEDTAQSDKKQEIQRQIKALPTVPVSKCSDIEIAEKNLPTQFAGLDSSGGIELNVTHIPSNDKHIVLEAYDTKNKNPENLIGNKNISVTEDADTAKCFLGEHELQKKSVLEPGEATCEHEEKTTQETTKSKEKSESKEIDKHSLSNCFEADMKETTQIANQSADEKETTPHNEDLQAEKADEVDHDGIKTDEEKDNKHESSEQKISELVSEAPVMVDMGDADAKVAHHKKSHNILSGVGSKVKHSLAKVKKAIAGKSSHPKPPSPK